MTKVAKATPRFISSNPIAKVAWEEELLASTLISDIDTGNISSSSTVTDASTSSPIYEIYIRPGSYVTIGGWRHFAFAIENVEGKTPIFKVDWTTRGGPTGVEWMPVYTVDHVNWYRATTRTFPTGFVQFTFSGSMPSGRVYVYSSPLGTYQDSVDYASYLLSNYPAIAAPLPSADSSGVYATSIAVNDDIGRAVGSNNKYAIKLVFPGPTTDGLRKRKMVMFAGIHAAGENISWMVFKSSLDWILESSAQEAIDFRANWDVYLYFLVNPNGVKGGNVRGDFASGDYDPNRQWFAGGLSDDVSTLMAVVPSDTGGSIDAFYSYHGDSAIVQDFAYGCHPEDLSSSTRTVLMQALYDYGSVIFGQSPALQGPDRPTDLKWAKENLSAKVSCGPEISIRYNTNLTWFTDIGEKWMKTIQAMDADGLFLANILLAEDSTQTDISATGQISQTHELTVAGSAQTDTSGTGVIGVGGISLAASSCEQTDAGSTGSLTQEHALSIAGSAETDTSSSGALTQIHSLSIVNSVQTDISSTGAITSAGDLAAANCSQSDTSASGTITQTHSFTAENSTQTDTSGTGTISVGSVINLAAANSAQTDTCQTAIITQTHILIIAPSVQDDVASSSAIVQLHLLLAASSTQTDTSSSATIINPLDALEIPSERIIAATRDNRIIYIDQWGRYGN